MRWIRAQQTLNATKSTSFTTRVDMYSLPTISYMLASDLHTSLDDLSTSLSQMIDSVNALSVSQKPSNDGHDDPMLQISQVLSSHLESLQWIDSAVRDVGGKVGEVEKRVKESGQSYGNGQRQRGFGLNR